MSEFPTGSPWLLRLIDREHREAIEGDLLEEYVTEVLPSVGRLRARWWLWARLLETVVRIQYHRVRPKRQHRSSPHRIDDRGVRLQGEIMAVLLSDIRFGVRTLLKNPGLTLVAVLTIAIGVGLTTHTFSSVYGAVIRGLPFEEGHRLVHFEETDLSQGIEGMGVTVHNYAAWREQQTALEDLAAFYQGTVNVADGDGRPQRLAGAFVTASMFPLLRVQPVLGRTFREGEDHPSAPPTMVLGYSVWQNRYSGDPSVIGRSVRANGETMTIIGVMPEKFAFPFQEDVWVPLRMDPVAIPRGEGMRLDVFGRLRAEVSMEEAGAQIASIAGRLAMEFPETNEGIGSVVKPYTEEFMPSEITAVLFAMLGAVFGVLLIACGNVANLLMAKAAGRSKEVAIRTALGASRARVATQFLVESFILSVVGGAVGLAGAAGGIKIFNDVIAGIEKPYWIDIRLDPAVLLFAAGVVLVSSIVSGVVPALRASGGNVNEILKDESRGSSSLRMGRFSTALVISEIAVSFGLLVGAGLMIKSVVNLKTLDMGFTTDNVFTARVGLFVTDYPDRDSRQQFFETLVDRLEAEPGVTSAALTTFLPSNGAGRWRFGVEGQAYPTDRDYPVANRVVITPRFFETLGVNLSRGRDFSRQDRIDAPAAAIVNQSFANRFFPDQDPVGKRIRVGTAETEEPWMMIAGVVPDLHVGGGVGGIGNNTVRPETFYTPLAQTDRRFVNIAVQTSGDPAAIAPAVRDIVMGIDANLPIYDALTMDRLIELNTWAFGVFGSLFLIFGAISLSLAAVGLYGVMAFSVGRRTQEMGVRIALGAHGRDIMRLVLKSGLAQLAIGIGLGIGLGYALGRPLEQQILWDVRATDPAVYLAIAITLSAAGLLACIVPARRATRVDPMEALRPE